MPSVTDYASLIDAETWAFIDRTNSYYPPDAVDRTIEEQRATYDRMCREFHAGHPAGVAVADAAIAAPDRQIPIRLYRAGPDTAPAVVLYFHGGGFILGGLDSHDDVCAEICQRTRFEVVSVDYRLVPEHTHPAAFDDARAAFDWAQARDSRPVVLAGDSAGGNLAAAVAHASRGSARPAVGQVLVYPGLGGRLGQGSYVTHADAPLLSVRDMDYYHRMRAGGRDVSHDPTFAPLRDRDYAGLPPTVCISAECDPLSDDGREYRDRILAAGGRAIWLNDAGLVHGHLRARHSVARARDSFGRIVTAIATLGRGEWPPQF